MIPDNAEDLVSICATVSVADALMRAYAAHANWGEYDVEDDPEELRGLAHALAMDLLERGFIDVTFIEQTEFPNG